MIEEVYSQDIDTKELARTLEQTFRAEGYKVQELGSENDIAVQIKKESTGRAVLGLEQAMTVRITKSNGTTKVSLGQAKWADKAGVEVIGALVFWPLMIPATYGVYKQGTLPGKIINVVNSYAASRGATTTEPKTSPVIACPSCGVTNLANSQYCTACGATLAQAQHA